MFVRLSFLLSFSTYLHHATASGCFSGSPAKLQCPVPFFNGKYFIDPILNKRGNGKEKEKKTLNFKERGRPEELNSIKF